MQKKEIPVGVVATIIVVVVVIVGIVGYSLTGGKKQQLSDNEQKTSEQTAEQQYRQFGPQKGQPGSKY